jgi:hypothetical protein
MRPAGVPSGHRHHAGGQPRSAEIRHRWRIDRSGCASSGGGGQGGEPRLAGAGDLLQPGEEPGDVQGDGGRDVLHVGLGQAPVVGLAELERSNSLGQRALDPRG